MLYNLIDNAIRYTPKGGTITLRAIVVDANFVCVEVHNEGEAIAESDLPHIFSSFYRGERARTRAEDGYRSTGLGLAIARGFVELHGGEIKVESQPTIGTTFSFTVPRHL